MASSTTSQDPLSQQSHYTHHASSTSSSSSLSNQTSATATTTTTSSSATTTVPTTTATIPQQQSKKSNETTLTHLTKRFVKLLNSSQERVINLNEASSRLSVAKRRIYDITNVLEGIGLLNKTSKNVTKWIDCPRDSPFAAPPSATTTLTTTTTTTSSLAANNNNNNIKLEPQQHQQQIGAGDVPGPVNNSNNATNTQNHTDYLLQNHLLTDDPDLIKLSKTYQTLEEGVNDLKAEIRQQLSGEGAYVTYQDIKSFFNDQIVIAVKAPPETRLEVNESLQIWMKSENGEIEVYLCPQYASNTNNSTNNNTNTNNNNSNSNLIGQANNISSDGEKGTTIGGVSTDDPILSSANTVGDEDPFEPLVPYAREDSHYNFMLDDDYTISSLFPDDNLGLY